MTREEDGAKKRKNSHDIRGEGGKKKNLGARSNCFSGSSATVRRSHRVKGKKGTAPTMQGNNDPGEGGGKGGEGSYYWGLRGNRGVSSY